MIKNLLGSRYIEVQGGFPSPLYIYNNYGTMGIGDVKYNPISNSLQTYDGQSWKDIPCAFPSINLTSEAELLLDWARKKREEEFTVQELAKNNNAVRIAYENLNKAQEQLKTTMILATEHDRQTTS